MRRSAMSAKVPAPKKTFGGDSAAEDHTGCDAQDGPGRSHAWWWLHHMKFDQGPRQKKNAVQDLAVFHRIEN